MSNSNLLSKAIAIAAKAFEYQTDKAGEPYILHCLYVMNHVYPQSDNILRICAVLHDLLEDCPEWDLDGLEQEGFPDEVLGVLDLLTHKPGISYYKYIDGLLVSERAVKIKMADLEHNSSILRLKGISGKDIQRIEKYHKAYLRLQEYYGMSSLQ